MLNKQKTQQKIHKLIKHYWDLEKDDRKSFIPGKTKIRYSQAFYGSTELFSMVDSMLEGWFGLGKQGEVLEKELTKYIGSKSTLLTNSGSSASLLCTSAITSYLFGSRIEKGSEVITPACTFSTTAAAIIHRNLIPKFVDIKLGTYNPDPKDISKAITKKTRVIFLPHTLGNPNEMDQILKIVKQNNLILIEDNCDALGSEYNGKKTGSFGSLATCSFYPAHHITLAGEGGAVFINDLRLHRVILTFRNWGRGCWCSSLEKDFNGACGNRFNFKIDGIPIDHKYYFLELGYNLKPVEIQAAMGRAQLRRFPLMAKSRRSNFKKLLKFFRHYEQFFILPESPTKADPCWFSLPLTIREKAPFSRIDLVKFLEQHLIETRTVFAGNIVRQPAMKHANYLVSGDLSNSDTVLKNTFFVGIGPHINDNHIQYIEEVFEKFFKIAKK